MNSTQIIIHSAHLKTSSLLLDSGKTVGDNGAFFKIPPKLPPNTIVEPMSERAKNECQ